MDNPNNQQKPNQQNQQPKQNQPVIKPVQQVKVQPQVKQSQPQKVVAVRQSAVMQVVAAFVVGILVGVIGVSIASKHSSPLYSTTASSTPSAIAGSDTYGSVANTTDSDMLGSTPTGSTGTVQVGNATSNNGVSVADQPAGSTVTLGEVDFQSSGWVAIHADANGKPGQILGAALFPAGKTMNATVSLLTPTISGTSYLAVLHFNDNPTSKVFDWRTDVILDDSTGHPIMMQFTAQ